MVLFQRIIFLILAKSNFFCKTNKNFLVMKNQSGKILNRKKYIQKFDILK